MIRVAQGSKKLSRLLYDGSLTKKAYLNAVSSAIDYGSQLLVAFLVTPWMVSGLGQFYYGVWQMLNRLVGYLSPATGKPTQALRWTIAHEQASDDQQQKRRYVGSAFAVWVVFSPLLGIAGAVVAHNAPSWLKAPPDAFTPIRLTALLLMANVLMHSLAVIPLSALQGENLGYRRIGLAAALTGFSGLLMWIVLRLDFGIVGVATVALFVTTLSGLLYLKVAQANVSWYGMARPRFAEAKSFFKLSAWFLVWDLIMKLIMASDVLVLGFLQSARSVTPYILTKYAPETVITLIAILVHGIVPGLGGIIGSGDLGRAARLRGEIMALSWLVTTVLATTILTWNRVFIALWVGEKQFAGQLPNFLIILAAVQLVFIRSDASIIDLTLRVQEKVLFGTLSVVVTIAMSVALVGFHNLGVTGLCLGLLLGRSVLSITYPSVVGRFVGVPLRAQLRSVVRPATATACLFAVVYVLGDARDAMQFQGVLGWLLLGIMAGFTALIALVFSFFAGLRRQERQVIRMRLAQVVNRAPI